MRLSYLDILEQCFHDKFRGYNKQEVDTFLHLVADDFKSMSEEIKEKERVIATKDNELKVLLAVSWATLHLTNQRGISNSIEMPHVIATGSCCYIDFLEQSLADLELRFDICVVGNVTHYCAGVRDECRVHFIDRIEV